MSVPTHRRRRHSPGGSASPSTSGTGLRIAGGLAITAALAVLAAACSGGHPSTSLPSSATTESSTYRANLAYAQCMRAHGLPGFPNPNPSQGSSFAAQPSAKPNSPAARAHDACKHLLRSGSTGVGSTTAPTTPTPSGPGALATDCLTLPRSPCYTPMQLRVAYGIKPLLDRGITGRGQTIVLLEFPPPAASTPAGTGTQVPASSDIRQDLADFDRLFGLPAAKLQIVNTLAHAPLPGLASIEEVADSEVVHALAPDAAIREVLIPSPYVASPARVTAAVVVALRLGLTQGGVVSLSAGAGEQCFTPADVAQVNAVLQAAQRKHVTMIVSTGDSGAATTACPPETGSANVKGVDLPASDPLALAVGGTTLQTNRKTGAYIGETAWNTPSSAGGPRAGGGGFSRLFPRPAYQTGIAAIGTTRGVPDVAADADPRTGMATAIAITGGSQNYVLIGGGGTSVAAPLWAAVIAIANQDAGHNLGFINPALYRIGHSTHYRQAFHDVTTGTNTVKLPTLTITGYLAAPGWDPLTGWGSPNAQTLVPLLTR